MAKKVKYQLCKNRNTTYKKLKDLRKSKKGFTLVELIVVLVILAILAAILVPALLGYIEKAKEKQITTNANAAYVAVQSLLDEQYGVASETGKPSDISKANITKLTSITTLGTITASTGAATGKDSFKLVSFSYSEAGTTVYITSTGNWTTDSTKGVAVTTNTLTFVS